MVCKSQVVVDRLRASDETCGMTGDDGVVRQLFDCVHGIISAYIDKCFNIQLIKNTEDFIVYFPCLRGSQAV